MLNQLAAIAVFSYLTYCAWLILDAIQGWMRRKNGSSSHS
jgi:hypothetical protein